MSNENLNETQSNSSACECLTETCGCEETGACSCGPGCQCQSGCDCGDGCGCEG